jgi:hypothetical protein
VKEVFIMKAQTSAYLKEYRLLANSLLKIPIVEGCEHLRDQKNGFIMSLVFKHKSTEYLEVTVLGRAFPSIIAKEFEGKTNERVAKSTVYPVLIAPYISDESAKLCEKLSVSYMDMSGNCMLSVGSLYISDRGHPNKSAKKRVAKSIFNQCPQLKKT